MSRCPCSSRYSASESMDITLRPSNIIIVGGSSGFGYATAVRMIDYGVNSLILASRNLTKLESAKEKLLKYCQTIGKATKVYILQFDIANISDHEALLCNSQNLVDSDGHIDGLVISSGIDYNGANWRGFNISEKDWDAVMNVNLKGAFFLIRNYSNWIHSRSLRGNICVVSSISAHRDLLSVYQVSKMSISRIVHAYGKYLCERGIVLNAVEPGPAYTDMMGWLEGYTDGVRPGKPWDGNSIRRLIRPEEVAEVICILMSQLGDALSGSCILMGGGTKALFP